MLLTSPTMFTTQRSRFLAAKPKPNPEVVLEALKSGATPRTQRSLDLIHAICAEQKAKGSDDFSIVTIGRISADRGGPSAQPIRNKTGEHYRTLIASWAVFSEGQTRKPAARAAPGVADDILHMIEDASVRAIVGVLIAEGKKLKAENTLLKTQAQVIVDRRPSKLDPAPSIAVQVLTPVDSLLPSEVDALTHAISPEHLELMGWSLNEKNGRITKGTASIFRPGFGTAIKKVIEARGG